MVVSNICLFPIGQAYFSDGLKPPIRYASYSHPQSLQPSFSCSVDPESSSRWNFWWTLVGRFNWICETHVFLLYVWVFQKIFVKHMFFWNTCVFFVKHMCFLWNTCVFFCEFQDSRDGYLYIHWYIINVYMGVSKNRDTPKWMVYNGKPH